MKRRHFIAGSIVILTAPAVAEEPKGQDFVKLDSCAFRYKSDLREPIEFTMDVPVSDLKRYENSPITVSPYPDRQFMMVHYEWGRDIPYGKAVATFMEILFVKVAA